MTEYINLVYSGVGCDSPKCTAEIRGPDLPMFDGFERYNREAIEAGWTIWVGRSRRHYCPEHGPKPGHKMMKAE